MVVAQCVYSVASAAAKLFFECGRGGAVCRRRRRGGKQASQAEVETHGFRNIRGPGSSAATSY